MILFETWWFWIGFGLILGILEILLPGFILLGFGIGAMLTGLVMTSGLVVSLPKILLVFAILSLAPGFCLGRFFVPNRAR